MAKFLKIMVNQRFRKNTFELSCFPVFEIFSSAIRWWLQVYTAFCLNSVVHGYHIYEDIWSSVHGKELHCKHEIGNIHNLYAVSVIKHGTPGYHGPPSEANFHSLSFLFKEGGNISCIVNGQRQYLSDLPQEVNSMLGERALSLFTRLGGKVANGWLYS